MTGKPAVLNIAELFDEGCVYRVPIYQRAYAWGADEIKTLLDDVRRADGQYYLGSLVVARCGSERNRTVYEVIDGQQRLTLFLPLSTFKGHPPGRLFAFTRNNRIRSDMLLAKRISWNKIG